MTHQQQATASSYGDTTYAAGDTTIKTNMGTCQPALTKRQSECSATRNWSSKPATARFLENPVASIHQYAGTELESLPDLFYQPNDYLQFQNEFHMHRMWEQTKKKRQRIMLVEKEAVKNRKTQMLELPSRKKRMKATQQTRGAARAA